MDQRDTEPPQQDATRPIEHIARVTDEVPSYAGVDPGEWVAIIDAWLTPLPPGRAWKQRHGHEGARHGRTRWADRDPDAFEDLRRAVAGQADAARSAWTVLNDAGFVTGAADDLVTATLAQSCEAA